MDTDACYLRGSGNSPLYTYLPTMYYHHIPHTRTHAHATFANTCAPVGRTTTQTAHMAASAPMNEDPACSRQEQAGRRVGGASPATASVTPKIAPRSRCRRDAPARCRHGRALPPPRAQTLPAHAGCTRRRQPVGARPRGGRTAAQTRASRRLRVLRGEDSQVKRTGAHEGLGGSAHRIETVGAGHEEHVEVRPGEMPPT